MYIISNEQMTLILECIEFTIQNMEVENSLKNYNKVRLANKLKKRLSVKKSFQLSELSDDVRRFLK